MLLIHGIGGSKEQWRPVIGLLDRAFGVVAIDLPGFGESAGDDEAPPTIGSQADAIERFLDTGFGSAHIVGNSSGGWLGLELARRGRARSVVALAPAGMWTRREDRYRYALLRNAHYSAKVIARFPALTRTPARRRALGWQIFVAKPGRLSADDAQEQMRLLGAAPSFMPFLKWTRGRMVEGLADIRCPVLIAWGSRDFLLPARQAGRFVRAIPGAEFRLLRGAGHVSMSDDPDLVASTIVEFARRADD